MKDTLAAVLVMEPTVTLVGAVQGLAGVVAVAAGEAGLGPPPAAAVQVPFTVTEYEVPGARPVSVMGLPLPVAVIVVPAVGTAVTV